MASPAQQYWPRVPLRVLKATQKRAGGPGEVYKLPGEDMGHVKCRFGDSVYGIMEEWISGLPVAADPLVGVEYAPEFNLLGTALCPPNAVVF